MLEANIRIGENKSELIRFENSLKFGKSTVKPFESRHILSTSWCNKNQIFIWIGEGIPDALSKCVDKIKFVTSHTFFEGIFIECTYCDNSLSGVKIARSSAGGSPIYMSTVSHGINISWKFDNIVRTISDLSINADVCSAYIVDGPTQLREQIFTGIFMLWPGESCAYHENGFEFFDCPRMPVYMSSALSVNASASANFIDLIENELSLCLSRSNEALVEVSGGLDSSCVAIAASRLKAGLLLFRGNSYGPHGLTAARETGAFT